MSRRTTLAFFNPSDRKKAERLAEKYRKEGYEIEVEKSKRYGTIDVMKVNKKHEMKESRAEEHHEHSNNIWKQAGLHFNR